MSIGRIAISGFRDLDFEDMIQAFYGSIASTVSKQVSTLVVKSTESQTSKTNKAVALGIPVMDKATFIATYMASPSPYELRKIARKQRIPKLHYTERGWCGLYWIRHEMGLGLDLSHGDCIVFDHGHPNERASFFVDALVPAKQRMVNARNASGKWVVPPEVTDDMDATDVADILKFYAGLPHYVQPEVNINTDTDTDTDTDTADTDS